MSYIYLIGDGEKYKIGFTKNVDKRVKEIQTGNPNPLLIYEVFETKHGTTLEKTIHRLLSHKKLMGEWFLLDYDDIKKFKFICQQIEEGLENISQTLID